MLAGAPALAGWGSTGYGSSGGYGASYGSSGGYSLGYGSSGGYSVAYGSSGYAYGSGGGILHRVHNRVHNVLSAIHTHHVSHVAARRAYYGSSGVSYYGSSGYATSYGSSGGAYRSSYGSSGGYSASYGSTGTSYGYGSSGTVSYGSSGVSYGSTGTYFGASNVQPTSINNLVSNGQNDGDAVYITVALPANAKIHVNGNPTTSTGSVRQFVSRGLTSGKSYRFNVRAEVESANGQLLSEEKELVVTAGQREQVQFAFATDVQPIETALTLNVPDDAQVTLAGNDTKMRGTARTFRTSQLRPGDVWDDYEVEVRVGEQIKRQNVRLIAGDKLELSFNFDESEERLAAR